MYTIILEIASPNKKITFYGSDGRKIMKCGSAMFSFWGKSSDSDIDITQGSFLNPSTAPPLLSPLPRESWASY